MNKKSLLLALALFLSSFTLAYARSYSVSLSKAARAGSVQLPAGQYKLTVDGTTVTFTDSHSKTYTATAKVQASESKNPATTIETAEDGNGNVIKAIRLGGSKETLQFTE
jgi:ABC-type glycerol-3-phosphate transport system substrate-binding protein